MPTMQSCRASLERLAVPAPSLRLNWPSGTQSTLRLGPCFLRGSRTKHTFGIGDSRRKRLRFPAPDSRDTFGSRFMGLNKQAKGDVGKGATSKQLKPRKGDEKPPPTGPKAVFPKVFVADCRPESIRRPTRSRLALGRQRRKLRAEGSARKRENLSRIIRTLKPTRHGEPGRLSNEAWMRWRVKRSLYTQWGYVRHQHSEPERPWARRAFKSWKIKLSHVMNPVNPSSWPWLDKGRWLFELGDLTAMQQAWESLDVDDRMRNWPLMMLSTMQLRPEVSSLVLLATLDPLPPGYAIHDVLLFVAQRLDLEAISVPQERNIKGAKILDLTARILEDLPKGHVPWGQRTLGLLARKLPTRQVDELLTLVSQHALKLHRNTLLQFASKLACEIIYKPKALEILKRLTDDGVSLNDEGPASVATSLLHWRAADGEDWDKVKPLSPNSILQSLVKAGLSPNFINATAFLDTLCQRGEVEEALRVALLFAECGIKLDSKAWATVFRGAKMSNKVANVVKAFDVAKAAEVSMVDILNNGLHSILCFADTESRQWVRPLPWTIPLFKPMLRAYAIKFELESLQRWLPVPLPLLLLTDETAPPARQKVGAYDQPPRKWEFTATILPAVEDVLSSADGPPLQPNATTMAIMLRCYIRSLSRPDDVVSFYDFFKRRLEAQSEEGSVARAMIKSQGSLIHDAFILAMSERTELSRQALHVFSDMIQGKVKVLETTRGRRERFEVDKEAAARAVHPMPTVLTYTILLHGLMRAGQRTSAERVLRLMNELGVVRNKVTWNTLVKGYASMQDVARTVATLQDMEAAGCPSDMMTLRAFGKLRKQARALDMMQRIIDKNRQKLEAERL